MTSYKLLLQLIVFVLAWFMFNCDMSFDCRRKGQNCMGGGICEGGACNCTGTDRKGFNCGIVTGNENTNQSACGCQNSGVCMNDSSCICTETHYGDKCQYKRDEILCFGDRKVIFLYPVGFTSGKIFINDKRDVPECQFKKVMDITERNDFKAEWKTGGGENGYALTINDTDNTCGNITVTEQADEITYKRLINIEFDNVIITSLDEIVSASCSFSNNSMRSIEGILVTTNLTSQVYNQSETINKYEPLVYSAKQGNSDIGKTPLLVGSEITFTFNIPPETGYESVIIETFQANATDVLELITAQCVNSSASSIIQSLSRPDPRTVELVVKVFKFVTSNDITFTGTARICRAGETACEENTSCQPKSFKGLGRRKRGSGDSLTVVEQISVTTDPNAARTSSEQTGNSENNQGTCQDSSAKVDEEFQCLQKSEIIIVLALMAATIVILLIVCVILTWRLLRTSPKVAEVQPSEYDTTHSLPRLVPTHF